MVTPTSTMKQVPHYKTIASTRTSEWCSRKSSSSDLYEMIHYSVIIFLPSYRHLALNMNRITCLIRMFVVLKDLFFRNFALWVKNSFIQFSHSYRISRKI